MGQTSTYSGAGAARMGCMRSCTCIGASCSLRATTSARRVSQQLGALSQYADADVRWPLTEVRLAAVYRVVMSMLCLRNLSKL